MSHEETEHTRDNERQQYRKRMARLIQEDVKRRREIR